MQDTRNPSPIDLVHAEAKFQAAILYAKETGVAECGVSRVADALQFVRNLIETQRHARR